MTLKYYKGKNTVKDTVFIFVYSLYLLLNILIFIDIPLPYSSMAPFNVGFSLLLILTIVCENKLTLKNFIMFLCFGMLCIVVGFISANQTALITTLLFVVCAKDLDYRIYIQRYFIICTMIIVFTISLYFLGFIRSTQWERLGIEGGSGFLRYSIGFKYTTFGPMFFMCAVFSYLAIKRSEINIIETFTIGIINSFLYLWTNTRSVYYLVFFALILFWIKRIIPKIFSSKLFCISCVAMIPILAISSVILPLLCTSGNDLILKLDEVLNHRLRLGQVAIIRYGLFNLFGRNIVWTSSLNGNLVDSSYLSILLEYGWIVLLLVVFGFMSIQYENFHTGKIGLSILIMLYLLHSFTDPQLLILCANPFLLILGKIFNPSKFKSTKIFLQRYTEEEKERSKLKS